MIMVFIIQISLFTMVMYFIYRRWKFVTHPNYDNSISSDNNNNRSSIPVVRATAAVSIMPTTQANYVQVHPVDNNNYNYSSSNNNDNNSSSSNNGNSNTNSSGLPPAIATAIAV